MLELSKILTDKYGKGFSRQNIQRMKMLYEKYPIFSTLSSKLSWSHYVELLSIEDDDKRSFYERETINSNWSIRELKRQISTSLFERLLLSNGKANRETVLQLAHKGNELIKPEDIVKEPYVLEFLGLPEAVGQINMYLNYYKSEVNDETDNDPIGIILSTDKDSIDVEFVLGGLSNNIFASKYTYYIPNKDKFIAQVESVLDEMNKEYSVVLNSSD